MLQALGRVLLWLLAGEAVARPSAVPIPGPVVGLALLFCELSLRGGVPEGVGALADGVLRHLSMLFIPAGVGVIAQLDLLRADALPIVAAVVGGTLVTIAVTAAAVELLSAPVQRRGGRRCGGIGHDADG